MNDPRQDVLDTLVEIIRELLINNRPSLELVAPDEHPRKGQLEAKQGTFEEVFRILNEAGFLEEDVAASGPDVRGPLPVVHPQQRPNLVTRIRLEHLSCAGALLRAFSLLRIRYQFSKQSDRPRITLVARAQQEEEVDALYLIGDALTERYPVVAALTRQGEQLTLELEGDAAEVGEGFYWDRAAYILSRDAGLIIRPLREALLGARRPLIVPRWTHSDDTDIRARIPQQGLGKIKQLVFLVSLHFLKEPDLKGQPVHPAGALGEHWNFRSGRNGYVVSDGPIQDVLPVRRRPRPTGMSQPLEEGTDGHLAIAFEGLGGVREIGANAYYYRFGRRGLLIDAGYDANLDGWLGLPALERLTRLDAIIVTHGHLDHIGSIPVLAKLFPNVPIYTTAATLDIQYATLSDSVRIAKLRYEETGEMPVFTEGLVTRLSRERFKTIEYRQPFQVPEIPGLELTFHDAGHVIGSAGVAMRFGEARIFHTGDISVEDQFLLQGMSLEPLEGHVVMEGTYGGVPEAESNRTKRRAAVDQFLQDLGERIEAGGTVLIPSFSLGRAQEVLALIRDWAEKKKLSFPVYAAGGQTIALNDVSKRRQNFFPKLKQDPFLFEKWPVLSSDRTDIKEELRKVTAKGPAVIIASHGMLMKGTSSYKLARALLLDEDDRHAIFLCGYMDPRTPGFRLLHQKDEQQIRLSDGDIVHRRLPSKRIGHYSLSAHASYEELIEVALRATRSVTLSHGDEVALDTLQKDISQRFADKGTPIPVRAPGLGERILLERVPAPEGWDIESSAEVLSSSTRKSVRRTRALSLRGVTPDPLNRQRHWALIPVGETEVHLAVETERIDIDRIESVVVAPRSPGPRDTLFDRKNRRGRLSDLPWSKLGSYVWTVHTRSPEGRIEPSEFPLECGAELRPVRLEMDAAAPVLEFAVGGRTHPLDVSLHPNAPARLSKFEWEQGPRILRLTLEPHEVGRIDPLAVRIRWPTFTQDGPAIEGLRFEPKIEVTGGPARVGDPARFTVRSSPQASAALCDGRNTPLQGAQRDQIEVIPLRPSPLKIHLGYGPPSQRVWTVAADLEVAPGAEVKHRDLVEAGKPVEVSIRALSQGVYMQEALLEIDGEVLDRWILGPELHTWSGTISSSGTLEILVRVPRSQLILWTGSLEVLSGLTLRTRGTQVTTSDGTVEAALKWYIPDGIERAPIEAAFRDAGFESAGWEGTTLRLRGTEKTLGAREVVITMGGYSIQVPILTLSDNQLQLEQDTPPIAGEWVSVRLKHGPLSVGLREVDGGPLTLEVTRIHPLRDFLSAQLQAPRMRLLHPGTYELALVAGNKQIGEHRFEVEKPVASSPPHGKERHHLLATKPIEAAERCSRLTAQSPIAVLGSTARFQILQDEADALEEQAWSFLEEGLRAKENILVISPGLSLHPISGKLLRRIWAGQADAQVARLSYPAPRGEIWQESLKTRGRLDRILCYLPPDTRVDLDDAYTCPQCPGRPTIETRCSRSFISCPGCDWKDEKTIITLNQMRQRGAQVLFTEYRMARYLSSGLGARYAGAFGRAVRCERCHSLQVAFPSRRPWVSSELKRLIDAATWAWARGGANRLIQRAARRAAQLMPGVGEGYERRFEDLLERLLAAGLWENGQPQGNIFRLDTGRSLCCDAELAWSPQRIRSIIVGIEGLLSKGNAGLHPELPANSDGISRLLSLTS